MTIFIKTSLSSSPESLTAGQQGTLKLGLLTDQSPTETAQIEYEIRSPAGVTFASTGTPKLTDSELVFSTGSTASTEYALQGPPSNLVDIRATVTPSEPPLTSATVVALISARALRPARRGAKKGPAPKRKSAKKRAPARKPKKTAASRARKSSTAKKTRPARTTKKKTAATRKVRVATARKRGGRA